VCVCVSVCVCVCSCLCCLVHSQEARDELDLLVLREVTPREDALCMCICVCAKERESDLHTKPIVTTTHHHTTIHTALLSPTHLDFRANIRLHGHFIKLRESRVLLVLCGLLGVQLDLTGK
jgi:hypothetical protein